jgi:hypothetical protein
MVRQWQDIIYGGRFHSIDLSASPDFVKLAEAYGGGGYPGVQAERGGAGAGEGVLRFPGPSSSTSWSTRTSSASDGAGRRSQQGHAPRAARSKDVKAKAAKSQTGF